MLSVFTATVAYAAFSAWALASAGAVGYWAYRSLTVPVARPVPVVPTRPRPSAAPTGATRPIPACCA